MSSLQDQLLKAGLVDQKRVAKANRDKNKKDNFARKSQKRKGAGSAAQPPPQGKKAQRDRELNEKRQQAVRQKEIAAQVKQLIDKNRQDRSKGELPYSFVFRSKVKKIFVTEAQKKQLIQGQLAIATHVARDGRKFDLVPAPVGEKIARRDAGFVVDIRAQQETEKAEDDAYADYQVPDDLTW